MSVLTHVAFIMDGNRRFAKRLMEKPWKGHEWGAKKVREVLEWCREVKIKYATFYSLSIENLQNRPKKEVEMLMNIFRREFSKIPADEEIHQNKVKVNVIGKIELLPADLQEIIDDAMNSTKHYNNYVVNFAIAYGGRQEILDAVSKIAREIKEGKLDVSDVDETVFRKHLYTNGTPDPDLIIRTSGEQRISGFLLWQAAYAELFFTKQLWPEFSKEEFMRAVNDYLNRERRFGR